MALTTARYDMPAFQQCSNFNIRMMLLMLLLHSVPLGHYTDLNQRINSNFNSQLIATKPFNDRPGGNAFEPSCRTFLQVCAFDAKSFCHFRWHIILVCYKSFHALLALQRTITQDAPHTVHSDFKDH